MKQISLALPVIVATLAFAQSGWAQSARNSNEYQRNQNLPAPKVGTSESRSAERKDKRDEMKATRKAGDIPKVSEGWGQQPARVPTGTHETRSAERQAKRDEVKQSVKAGTMPITTEAEVSRAPTTSR